MRNPAVLAGALVLPFLTLSMPRLALACAACFAGDADSLETKGAGNAVLFLLAVTYGVLGGMVIFGVHLWRRGARSVDQSDAADRSCPGPRPDNL